MLVRERNKAPAQDLQCMTDTVPVAQRQDPSLRPTRIQRGRGRIRGLAVMVQGSHTPSTEHSRLWLIKRPASQPRRRLSRRIRIAAARRSFVTLRNQLERSVRGKRGGGFGGVPELVSAGKTRALAEETVTVAGAPTPIVAGRRDEKRSCTDSPGLERLSTGRYQASWVPR